MADTFINPYNFVRYDTDPERIKGQRDVIVHGHDKLAGNSGRLTCELRTLSHIFVGDSYERNRFYRIGSPQDQREFMLPGIPGSSIKGAIRSVAEAIASSCFSLISKMYKDKVHTNYERENCKLSISDKTGLCITCRLFGSSTDDENYNSFSGKVHINDALLSGYFNHLNNYEKIESDDMSILNVQNSLFYFVILRKHTLSGPKPHHEAFYVENKMIRGRKFYYHQNTLEKFYTEEQKETEIDRIQKIIKKRQEEKQNFPEKRIRIPKIPEFDNIELVNPNFVFTFTVDYHNLSNIELGLLCHALQLECNGRNNAGVAHKIGQGKPIGLGSSLIKIIKIEETPSPAERYKKLQNIISITDPDEIAGKINCWIGELESDQNSYFAEGWTDLQYILQYPPYNHAPIKYPSMDWFRSNSLVRLPTPDDVRNNSNMLME